MSRYRFRIWDNAKGEWLGASDKNSVTFKDFDLCDETLRMQQLPMDIEDGRRYVIEQWIGSEDVGGRPMFDGDIVRYQKDPQHCSGEDFIGVIFYDSRHNAFYVRDARGYSHNIRPKKKAVVGNVHETLGVMFV